MKKTVLFVLLTLAIQVPGKSQNENSFSGFVRDSVDNKPLAGVNVIISGSNVATVSANNGYFSLSLTPGFNEVTFSFIGYKTLVIDTEDQTESPVRIYLAPDDEIMEAVEVLTSRQGDIITGTEMGVERLTPQHIKTIPALLGEVDIIKAVQLLPGVQAAAEGSTGFSVRGGGHDQNHILLDDATIYSASHLMGFFSVFNNDAVEEVTLYKGDIPASFGGRLSSMLDIRTRDGNHGEFSGYGGIGLISSRLTLDGPLPGPEGSFLVSGRRTYADIFLRLSGDDNLRNSNLYFYDTNLKLKYNIKRKHHISLGGYLGRDHLSTDFAGMDFGNKTVSAKWNYKISDTWKTDLGVFVSGYDYKITTDLSEKLSQFFKSGLTDFGTRAQALWSPSRIHETGFGIEVIRHGFNPGKSGAGGKGSVIDQVTVGRNVALHNAIYISNETSPLPAFKIRYGVRLTSFHNISRGNEIEYLSDYTPVRIETFRKGKIYNSYFGIEPRIGMVWITGANSSVKASWSRTSQYIQVASNSAAGSPLDIWFPASQNIKPQLCDQFSAGYFRTVPHVDLQLTAELFYKDMRNVVDFVDHADLIGNEHLEREIRSGKGHSYGIEFMARRTAGAVTGWVSYTYSRAYRKINGINDGRQYKSQYDRPHNISLVINWQVSRKFQMAANWIYATGMPVTFPQGRYKIENTYIPIYGSRNSSRYPDYHRLDFSATLNLSKKNKRLRNELNFSLYNAYGRKNPWTIFFREEETWSDHTYAEMIYLFSFVPSVTWNFTF